MLPNAAVGGSLKRLGNPRWWWGVCIFNVFFFGVVLFDFAAVGVLIFGSCVRSGQSEC